VPRRFHIDEHGSLRSGWLSNAEPDPDDGSVVTPTPNADAGAGRGDRPARAVDMNEFLRDAAAMTRTWHRWSG
jgi:hypothetical protein